MVEDFKPHGYHTITPYLVVPDIPQQIAFLEATFGATATEQLSLDDGTVNHAEVAVSKGRFQRPSPAYGTVPDQPPVSSLSKPSANSREE